MVTKSKNSCKLGNKVPNQPARDKIKTIMVDFYGIDFECGYNQDEELVTVDGIKRSELEDAEYKDFTWDFLRIDELEFEMHQRLTANREDYSAEMRSDESRFN